MSTSKYVSLILLVAALAAAATIFFADALFRFSTTELLPVFVVIALALALAARLWFRKDD